MTTLNAAATKRARQQRGLDPEAMAAEIGVSVEALQQFEVAGYDGDEEGELGQAAERVRKFYAFYGGDVRTGPSSS
jgi:hypothetical protein